MQPVTAEQLLAIEYAKFHFSKAAENSTDDEKIAILYEKYNEAMEIIIHRDQDKLKTKKR